MPPTAVADPLPSFKDAYRAARETHEAAAARGVDRETERQARRHRQPDLGHELPDDGDVVLEARDRDGEDAEAEKRAVVARKPRRRRVVRLDQGPRRAQGQVRRQPRTPARPN